MSLSHEISPTSVIRVPPHVVYRSFPDETVVLNLNTGKYHGLNATAARMLEVLERSPSLRGAAATLADEYGRPQPTVELDLVEFCSGLAERELIEARVSA